MTKQQQQKTGNDREFATHCVYHLSGKVSPSQCAPITVKEKHERDNKCFAIKQRERKSCLENKRSVLEDITVLLM